MCVSVLKIGDRQPRTIPTKDLLHQVVFLGGWCANFPNLRKRQNTHHPQFCTLVFSKRAFRHVRVRFKNARFRPSKHPIVLSLIGVSETGSAKTGSAIDVRIDDAESILKFRIGFSL